MSSPQPAAAQQAAMAPPRRSRLSSVFVGGVFSTGVLLWTLTNRLEMPVSGAPGFRHIQHSKQSNTGCECLLDLHCPRYNFDYPQEKETYCKIYRFPLRSTQSCLKWRDHQFGRSTHIVLLGDLRLLYLYRYIRDELMSESERVEGPAYCRSVHKNWTHPYLQEAAAAVQPPEPCRHLAMNRLAKLEYLWTADSLWPDVLQRLIDRCRLGVCPSVLVVSSRLDLALRDHEDKRELSMSAVSEHVRRVRPLLELLRSYGVHVWWKLHENLLDMGLNEDVPQFNEIIQQHNLKLIGALSRSTIPVWSSTGAVGWMHHHTCEARRGVNASVSPDFRCHEPYYLGNWAQKQYLDTMLNFLCGRVHPMAQNPCCVGWS